MHEDLTAERSLSLQALWAIGVLGTFFDMASLGVITTGHWQTSGRLVHELNVCIVLSLISISFSISFH